MAKHTQLSYGQIQRALTEIQRVTKGYAVAAGGCVRDTFLKAPVKDIDVFLQLSEFYTDRHRSPRQISKIIAAAVKSVDTLLHAEGSYAVQLRGADSFGEDELGEEQASSGTADNEDVLQVWRWKEAFCGFPMDIIFVDSDPMERIKTFDFGICQAYIGAQFPVKTLPAFQKDYVNKTITFNLKGTSSDTDTNRPKFRQHLARIMAKYPGWSSIGLRP